jgi:hypothetical protein
MTSDPKAPGAAAVYLYREEVTDDTIHYHSYHERIKVLTEKGKELATIHVPYEHGPFKVVGIKGRTIHSDGTLVPLTARPTDLVDVKNSAFQFNTITFTLPSVEVGSILEYKLDIEYGENMVVSPVWIIQQPYFVHSAHYMFKMAAMGGGRYLINSHNQTLNQLLWAATALPLDIVKTSPNGVYTIDLTDIPPVPEEDWMPPLNRIRQRVEFYYSYAATGNQFWTYEGKQWAKDTERFIHPGGEIKNTVATMVSPSDSDEQKARKLYAAVQKLDNTDFSRTKSEAERKAEKIKEIKAAEDVWKQQSGTGDEIALLYVSLARAAGLQVWPMKVADRSRAIFDASYLNVGQLDDYIAVISLNGQDTFLDPGQKMCPFGLLHWKHTFSAGLRLAEKGATIATTPAGAYKSAVTQRVGDLTLEPDASIKGTIRIVMAGPEALHWRQLALQNDFGEVKKRFNEEIRGEIPDGIQAEFDHFLGLDDPEVNLIAYVKISGNMGTATGKRLFLPGLFFQSRSAHPFIKQDTRTTPIDVHYARMSTDDVTYHLPSAFTVESSPQTTDVDWPNNALFRIRTAANPNQVEVARSLAYAYTYLKPKDYGDLRNFYLKVASADQQQIVLTRVPAAKGN